MSSHAVAIGLSAFAYAAARKHEKDTRFAFGTWKMCALLETEWVLRSRYRVPRGELLR